VLNYVKSLDSINRPIHFKREYNKLCLYKYRLDWKKEDPDRLKAEELIGKLYMRKIKKVQIEVSEDIKSILENGEDLDGRPERSVFLLRS